MRERNQLLDFFKGIAIIAVVLYHAKWLTFGYLGVDIFLVIGGFLITKSILHSYQGLRFSYWNYLYKRLLRLWPLVLIVTAVSLGTGYFTMMPDAYKNTCETAVGTVTFTNNFVQYITAGNYWDTSNDYKPLMHTWYLGVLFQFYLLYPFIFMVCHRFSKDFIKTSRCAVAVITLCSLLFFVLYASDTAVTFYLLPSRFFEMSIGGLMALRISDQQQHKYRSQKLLFFIVGALLLLCVNNTFDPSKTRLLLTVGLTLLVVQFCERMRSDVEHYNTIGKKVIGIIAPMGLASYSIYLWHQVLFSFFRYIFVDDTHTVMFFVFILLTLALGYASYLLLEKPMSNLVRKKFVGGIILFICLLVAGILSTISVKHYYSKGVVRDFPELDVYLNDASSWEPHEYNARISTLYSKEFPKNNGKKNVLVVGDSYARDWINVLLESNIDSINIVYSEKVAADLRSKITQADIIFVANNGPIDQYVNYLPAMMKKRFYRVGHKFFGYGVGSVYNHARMTGDYKRPVSCKEDKVEEMEMVAFQGRYIDIMQAFRNDNGTINFFTPERKLVTHDGIHLTKAGAILLSQRLPEMKLYFE